MNTACPWTAAATLWAVFTGEYHPTASLTLGRNGMATTPASGDAAFGLTASSPT